MPDQVELVQENPPRGLIGNQTTAGDIDECQRCGINFNQAYGGYFVDDVDLGSDPKGGTGRIFKQDVEKSGKAWKGFSQEDIGPWCDSCSWTIQAKRSESSQRSGENQ